MKREIRKEIEQRVEMLEKIIKAYEDERKKTTKGHNLKTIDVGETSINTGKNVLKKTEENERLLKENGRVIGELKERIEQQDEREKEMERKRRKTYAKAVAICPSTRFPERTTLHSMVVTSKKDKDIGDEVMRRLRKAANEDEGWVRVEKVRKSKDRKVIIGYKTEEERNKAQKRLLEREKNLALEGIKNKDPLLIMYSVLKNQKDEELVNAVRCRNREIF